MMNTTGIYDGEQIQLNIPDNPLLNIICKCLHEQISRTFDFRIDIIQLFDSKKNHMRLQIIRTKIDYDDTNEHEINTNNNNNNMPEVLKNNSM
ncbi:unnamed protein product [Rotaria sp. Silwood2]|nr:unnamed protein product [Rotaria sp. Silwood2]CAF4461813.1 unnamed protein product [Rotaria sp. Silwood2]CAF4624663.1 unnamed protein product [Rotaria sp. Silwood2]